MIEKIYGSEITYSKNYKDMWIDEIIVYVQTMLSDVMIRSYQMVDIKNEIKFTKEELKTVSEGMSALRASNARMIAKGGDDELIAFYKKRDAKLLNLINKIGSMEIFP